MIAAAALPTSSSCSHCCARGNVAAERSDRFPVPSLRHRPEHARLQPPRLEAVVVAAVAGRPIVDLRHDVQHQAQLGVLIGARLGLGVPLWVATQARPHDSGSIRDVPDRHHPGAPAALHHPQRRVARLQPLHPHGGQLGLTCGQTAVVPEGDTIRRLADKIGRRFLGQRCTSCVTRDPRLSGVDLTGAHLVSTDAVGKHLLLRFEADGWRTPQTLHSHLRMQGSWVVGRRATEPQWRRRIELQMDDGWLTGIDLPVLSLLPTQDEGSVVGHLGPDLCGPIPPDLDEVTERLHAWSDRPLAAALLDQRVAAGWGNLYAVEVPFIAGVSPNQHVDAIDGVDRIVDLGVALIRTNAARGPQNTTGRKLDTSDHWVYARRGRPCPLCGTTLAGWSERESPWRRVATWCPQCQADAPVRSVDAARIAKLMSLHPARRLLASLAAAPETSASPQSPD
jgi:endonuclease VIII